MRKISVFLALLATVLLLAGCQNADHSAVRAHTATVLKQNHQVWHETATAVSIQGQAGRLSAPQFRPETILSPWVSDRGRLKQGVTYRQRHYATQKAALIGTPFENWVFGPPHRKHHPHLLTVAQVNAALKVLGAKARLSSLDELVYLKGGRGQASVEPVGILCEEGRLYVIQVSYYPLAAGAEISRGAVYTR
ncbi:hypothetical protein ACFQ3L_06695 [Lacticaseibacillus jixianensis]|uniref:Uncharacterized protein n=1 Tax=Lacticaseibacillus jixianensis TaxID=2486012 RepID=A0ABW4B930_9LACO|nr:hypothetical protein [Lacticaseibacillus jixianensis]